LCICIKSAAEAYSVYKNVTIKKFSANSFIREGLSPYLSVMTATTMLSMMKEQRKMKEMK
jgi:hypothetical protein